MRPGSAARPRSPACSDRRAPTRDRPSSRLHRYGERSRHSLQALTPSIDARRAGPWKLRSDAALASVSAQGAGDLRRLGPLLQRADPPTFADRLAVDRVLEPLEERFQLVDPLLQDFDTPLLPRRLGRRVGGPPGATHLNHAAENRRPAHRAPTWIAGTRHGRGPPTASFSWKPRERRRKQDPTSGAGRTGRLVSKTTRQPTCPPLGVRPVEN